MASPEKRIKLTFTSASAAPLDEDFTETDLPLLANVDEVKVHHYLMKLKADFKRKIIKGTIVLFLEWLQQPENAGKVVLDACCLNVKNVYSLKTTQEYNVATHLSEWNGSSGNRRHFYKSNPDINWFEIDEHAEPLHFLVSKWTTTISGWAQLPSVVRLEYETRPSSPSLHWRPCSGFKYESPEEVRFHNVCAYTPAPQINNRGLFPCQEHPSVQATWEALLEVDTVFTPLLTSDEPGEVVSFGKDTSTHYFYTSVPLPPSTFAMVIGQFCLQTTLRPPTLTPFKSNDTEGEFEETHALESFCKNHVKHPCRFSDPSGMHEKIIPVRLISLDAECISSLDLDRFTKFIFNSLEACFDKFGPHPFSRLDLVLMPKCFPHLALTSPSMVFLSPSNFSGIDEPQFVCRIVHEICHSWFGLSIGDLQWREEWLSEGFATFCEDVICKTTFQIYFPNKSKEEVNNELALKVCSRFIALQAELKNTAEDLHKMKEDTTEQAAKNGLLPIKQFMNMHYYKGYLLLWNLALKVGEKNFSKFLKEYVWKYHSQLVSSEIFLTFYFKKFNEKLYFADKESFLKKIREEWLESDSLPPPFNFNAIEMLRSNIEVLDSLPLFGGVASSIKKVRKLYVDLKAEKATRDGLRDLSTSEFLLLFSLILVDFESFQVQMSCYQNLSKIDIFSGKQYNPDIMHCWCELIVACKDQSNLFVVENFLQDNISMGVFLYGELMISEKHRFQKLAKDVFYKLEGLYDMSTKRILKEMLF